VTLQEPAVRIEGLGKRYQVGQLRNVRTLGEDLARWVKAPFRRRDRAGDQSVDGTLWALRNFSLEVAPGEVVGIIGRNGAGKSTLLKILSKVTAPTEGMAHIEGRVGALLEAGTGFHSELTGRENVFLSGAILGMRKTEIERKFDQIVAFADIGPFLDTPVKRYSSGMQVRLAFAVAAHLEPEVLIVDEVLAVGDAEFQRKCLGRIGEVSRSDGRTVLFVSHNMDAVQRLCDRAVLLDKGEIVAQGATSSVVAQYLKRAETASAAGAWIDLSGLALEGDGTARVRRARYWSDLDEAGSRPYPDGPLTVALEIEATKACTIHSLSVVLSDLRGTKLVNADTIKIGRTVELTPGKHHLEVRIPEVHLNPGVYVMGFWVAGPLGLPYDRVPSGFEVEVVAYRSRGLGRAPGEDGSVTCDLELKGPE
jgi:ABC-type polysaccharide/polyol phosphate transport system ATPase subunit